MNWKPLAERTNQRDVMADVQTSRGTVRYVVRGVGHKRDRCYVIRRNGKEIGRTEKLNEAKEMAEWYEAAMMPSDHRLEGKTYAVRAIKLAMSKLEEHDDYEGNSRTLDESYEYLQAAIDVLEGRVPRFATLPEVE